jgi:predicted nucleic acid-binding protein
LSASDAEKHRIAKAIVLDPTAIISTQVLGEFYTAATSARRTSPLTPDEAAAWVQFWKKLSVESITTPHVNLALEIAKRYQVSYNDGLILAAARLANCAEVLSEDLNASQDYGGVRVRNPYAATDARA